MANDQKEEAGAAPPETDPRAPKRRNPLFGALKGYMQVMPRTDLTNPADPTWGDDGRPET
jgi:hypothetical protein